MSFAARAAKPPSPQGTDPFAAYAWKGGNNLISSYGRVEQVSLQGLPEGSRELKGEWANIIGRYSLEGNYLRAPFVGDGTSLVTDDRFDQVFAYHCTDTLARWIVGLGFDFARVIRKCLPIKINVNLVPDSNAWYLPPTRSITTGRSEHSKYGPWHLASDGDVLVHEVGHLLLDCINPAFISSYARDGGAIHEGFGDALTAFRTGDPQMSEDFLPNIGKEHYGTDRGLRNVDNLDLYGHVSREVHSLGRVYGGFWWSVVQKMIPLLGNSTRGALDFGAQLMINHGAHYTTNRPEPRDFVDAVVAALKVFLKTETGKAYDVSLVRARNVIVNEAKRRLLLQSDVKASELGIRSANTDGLLELFTGLGSKMTLIEDEEAAARGLHGAGCRYFRQYHVEGGKHLVKMMYAGINAFTDLQGNITGFSSRDFHSPVPISTRRTFRRADLLSRMKLHAKEEWKEAERAREAIERRDVSSEEEEFARDVDLGLADAEIRAKETAYRKLNLIQDHTKLSPVILPAGHLGISEVEGPRSLIFTLEPDEYTHTHFSTYFANARTGKVASYGMPLW